jgi:tRNA dimethylallyltransferase
VEIALALRGEVVNADSRLFCRGFDIGTAKPGSSERKAVPHHLMDVVAPGETLGLRAYLDLANAAIASIASRGNLPVVVGGTGQYVWGLLEGWEVARVPPDPRLRASLEREAEEQGAPALLERLRRLDPEAAARIDPRNVRRIIRAFEVARSDLGPDMTPANTGAGAGSGRRKAAQPPYDTLVIGLTMPRAELYRRVDGRIDQMLARGWVDEVRRLLAAGVRRDSPCMEGIGYGAMAAAIAGEISIEEAVRRARHDTRRLVRHQYGWFRLADPRIRWLDTAEASSPVAARAVELVRDWLE